MSPEQLVMYGLGLVSAFISGYALGKANAQVDVIEVPHGHPPPRGYRPVQTLYGPAPLAARLGVAHPPEGPVIYAYRLHETCDWCVATEGAPQPDGTLLAKRVYVRGHWEETVEVDAGKWCTVSKILEG